VIREEQTESETENTPFLLELIWHLSKMIFLLLLAASLIAAPAHALPHQINESRAQGDSVQHKAVPRDRPSTDVSEVRFLYWDRSNSPDEDPKVLPFGDSQAALAAGFAVERQTIVLVHGFSDSGTTTWVRTVGEALLEVGNQVYSQLENVT